MGRKIDIFLIYTSDDNDIMLRLLRHLQPLKELHNISLWFDDPIYSGQLWKPQIESNLNDADIFLILVSDAFMHSKFIDQSEFKMVIDQYKEGQSVVLPILIDNCPWDIDFRSDDYNFNFKELQVLPERGKPIMDWDSHEEALDRITAVVASEIATLIDEKDQVQFDKIIKVTPTNTDDLDQMKINGNEEKETEAQRKAEEEKLFKEKTNRPQIHIEASSKVEKVQKEKNKNLKKRVLVGSLIAVFAIVGIWLFSLFNWGSEKHSTPLPNENTIKTRDSSALSENEIDSVRVEGSLSKLGIGTKYDGGIVFSISSDSKTGKIVSPRDAGPMPWKNAIKIHEQLGEGWRLPTLDELKTMRETIGQGATNSGQFADGLYWSATPYDDYQARLLRFRDGNTSYHYNKEAEHRKFLVRAVRDFSQ